MVGTAKERDLYEAVKFATKEAQSNGASVPFDEFLDRIELMLGRDLTDEEIARIKDVFAKAGWLFHQTPPQPSKA